jgi:hypothetical protein
MPTTLRFRIEGDNVWPDLPDKLEEVIRLEPDAIEFAALSAGMTSGNPSIAARIDFPDGRVAFWETSMANFLMMADVFAARYRSEVMDPGAREQTKADGS